jgi:hypothetical protein
MIERYTISSRLRKGALAAGYGPVQAPPPSAVASGRWGAPVAGVMWPTAERRATPRRRPQSKQVLPCRSRSAAAQIDPQRTSRCFGFRCRIQEFCTICFANMGAPSCLEPRHISFSCTAWARRPRTRTVATCRKVAAASEFGASP